MIRRGAKRNLQTREITETEAWEILDEVLDGCRRHGVGEVILIYGYDWDVGEKSWVDQSVEVGHVCEHVRAQEQKERGALGHDDLYLEVGDAVQVLFCHHGEVHLGYDRDDLPLAQELCAFFIEKVGLKKQ